MRPLQNEASVLMVENVNLAKNWQLEVVQHQFMLDFLYSFFYYNEKNSTSVKKAWWAEGLDT